jgi:hypothetical protein
MFASLTIRHLPDISYRPMFASPTQPALTGYFKQTDVRVSNHSAFTRNFIQTRCSRLLPNRHLPDISYRPMFASPTQPAFTGYFKQTDVRVSYPTGIYRIFHTDAMFASPTIRHLPEISYRRDVRASNPIAIYPIFRIRRDVRVSGQIVLTRFPR